MENFQFINNNFTYMEQACYLSFDNIFGITKTFLKVHTVETKRTS